MGLHEEKTIDRKEHRLVAPTTLPDHRRTTTAIRVGAIEVGVVVEDTTEAA
jgi:hypothetical protein